MSAYTNSVIVSAIRMAFWMVRAGSRTSSPSVAIRAYPANAKNSSPAAWSRPRGPAKALPVTAAPPPRRHAIATAISTASTSATITRVAQADFCTPR